MIWFFIAAYTAWCVFLYLQQDRIIFPRRFTPAPAERPYGDDAVLMTVQADTDTTVEAWFLPAHSASAEHPAPLVIYFHGNAELIDYQHWIVEGYRRLGCSVLLPEYRGYGRSGGTPSQRGIRTDAVRFYDDVVKRPEVDADRIIVHGRSIGGGVAADFARVRRPAALVLDSTLTSVGAFAIKHLAPPFLVKHPFRTARFLAESDVPALIFHGARDEVIPVSHGRRLGALARNATYVEFDCGHNDFPGEGNQAVYWETIAKFLVNNGIGATPGKRRKE